MGCALCAVAVVLACIAIIVGAAAVYLDRKRYPPDPWITFRHPVTGATISGPLSMFKDVEL